MQLEQLEYDHNIQQETDKNLMVRFFMEPLQDDEASADAGRPIFKEVEFIEIRVRGVKNDVVQRPAHTGDHRRFSAAYQAFKTNTEEALVGTPLKEWGPLTRSLVLELSHMGFQTVEQLANASDTVCGKMAGLQTFKQKAKIWLEMSKGSNAPLEKLMAENTELKNQNATMANQIQEIMRRLEVQENAKVKK